MRLAFVVVTAVITLASVADAEREDAPTPHDPQHGDFWRTVDDPHADEVTVLVGKCRAAMKAAHQTRGNDLDASSLENRDRLYREVTAILTYARGLSPRNVEVLELLGQAADEAGRPDIAVEALHAAIAAPRETTPRDDRDSQRDDRESATRLAGIYLRRGQLDQAIDWARTALTSYVILRNGNAHAMVYLSTALALRGDMYAAIDVLQLQQRDQSPTLATFALVVQLDRDEQRGASTDLIQRMHNLLTDNFAEQMLDDVAHFRFAPAEDEYYFRALLDENLEAYAEARAEWLLYAAFDTPYRRRALDHVAAIDTLRRARPVAPQSKIPPVLPPPLNIHRRIHP